MVRSMRLSVFLAFLMVFVPFSALAQEGGSAVAPEITVQSVRIHDHGTHTRIVFDLSQAVQPETFTLAGEAGRPHRVVMDLPEVIWEVDEGAQFPGEGLIGQVRYARNRPGRSRVVLDMPNPASIADLRVFGATEDQGARVVMDLVPSDQASFEENSGFPVADAAPAEPEEPVFEDIEDILASLPDNLQGPMLEPVEEDPVVENVRPVIVIDAGHGGRDPGAITVNGVQEKTIALGIARTMRDALTQSGLFDVHMTRNEDILLPLNDRYAIAQDLAADLFVSIHVDSNDSAHARGVTVYTLSEDASDDEAARVADRENQSDRIAGFEVDEELTRILIDLAQRETMNLSADLASSVVRSLGRADVRTVSRPHRFAGFRVLTAPDVPSILLETGFASNAQDADLLETEAYRLSLGMAMTEALVHYFDLGDPGELWLAQNASPRD